MWLEAVTTRAPNRNANDLYLCKTLDPSYIQMFVKGEDNSREIESGKSYQLDRKRYQFEHYQDLFCFRKLILRVSSKSPKTKTGIKT